MFTGIVQGTASIQVLEKSEGLLSYALELNEAQRKDLSIGASVSVDGCCQTVVRIEGNFVYFQAIQETLKRTTLGTYTIGQFVNIERSARFGDEIGGHVLSGHIFGTASLQKIEKPNSATVILHIKCPREWMSFIFEKGYIAIDGASLTVVDVSSEGMFTVHLIPETLRRTTIAQKKENSLLNIEIDSLTQTVVQTVKQFLQLVPK
jgi:riboflavin synthase